MANVPLAGAPLSAGDLSAIFPVDVDDWATYTPTLTQSATPTKTISYARYMKVGRLVVAQAAMSLTSSGTGGNRIEFGLPVAAAGASQMNVGTATLFDASAATFYLGTAMLLGASVCGFIISGVGNYAGISGFSAALANADFFTFSVTYESSS